MAKLPPPLTDTEAALVEARRWQQAFLEDPSNAEQLLTSANIAISNLLDLFDWNQRQAAYRKGGIAP